MGTAPRPRDDPDPATTAGVGRSPVHGDTSRECCPMPVSFPTLDPDTGQLVPTDYYTIGEVAELFHVSHSTVRRQILDGAWPHMTLAHSHYMSAAHVAAVVEMNTHNPGPAVPEAEGPPRLGTPLADTDLEGIR